MAIYRCRPGWDQTTPGEVVERLERAWVEHGAFEDEAHAIAVDAGQVALDFVTWWSDRTFSTGRILVDHS